MVNAVIGSVWLTWCRSVELWGDGPSVVMMWLIRGQRVVTGRVCNASAFSAPPLRALCGSF